MTNFDSEWELSSGLPLDGAIVTVTKAEFGYRQQIARDVTFACLTFTPESGDEQEQCYSVGKGWEPGAKGASLTTSDGRPRKLNDSTNYGRWIAAALKLDGLRDALIARNGDPKSAATWTGLRFELATVKIETTNPTTQQKSEKPIILPVKFLGTADTEPAKVAGTSASSAGKAASQKTTATDKPVLDPDLEAKLIELAAAAPDHDTFMAQAFDIEGVAGDADAENAVMASGKGSVWMRGQAVSA